MEAEKISLYYKDASSDKEYHAQLQPQDGGWMVLTQNGKRGGTLASTKKTATPVDYAVAKKAYDKVVKEKLGKGYTEGGASTAYIGGELEARFTGYVPQLLNKMSEDDVESKLADPNWFLQNKHDGHHRLVQRTAEGTNGINRKGLLTGLPQTVLDGLAAISTVDLVLDGELMGDTLALFDVLVFDGKDLRDLTYEQRLPTLEALSIELAAAGKSAQHVYVTKTARTEAQKRAYYAELKQAKGEGAVFKRKDAPYVAGRPNSGGNQLKRVWLHRASFLVASKHPTKRSVSVELYDEAGHPVPLGKCTIPANYDIPNVGAIVDIEYLYAFPGGSIYHSRYKGERDDIPASDCVIGQLHYKTSAPDADDSDADDADCEE